MIPAPGSHVIGAEPHRLAHPLCPESAGCELVNSYHSQLPARPAGASQFHDGQSAVSVQMTERLLVKLSDACLRHLIKERPPLGKLPPCEAVSQRGAELLGVRKDAALQGCRHAETRLDRKRSSGRSRRHQLRWGGRRSPARRRLHVRTRRAGLADGLRQAHREAQSLRARTVPVYTRWTRLASRHRFAASVSRGFGRDCRLTHSTNTRR